MNPITLNNIVQTQGQGLSNRLSALHAGGQHLNDDSKGSENNLVRAINNVMKNPDILQKVDNLGGKLIKKDKISLYECQQRFKHVHPDAPEPCDENKNVCMKPDGGILFIDFGDTQIPILTTEDKCQGSNDSRFEKGLPRQATGNAIERGSKNILGAGMLYEGYPYFPYLLFAHGCDFHSSETIAKRMEMGNYGIKNIYSDISPEVKSVNMDYILQNININKQFGGKSIATILVKAHKYNLLPHGASAWTTEEITEICLHVVHLVLDPLLEKVEQK